MCWVISEDRRFDRRDVELDVVLVELVGYRMGTLVSCVAGKLAIVGKVKTADSFWRSDCSLIASQKPILTGDRRPVGIVYDNPVGRK